MSYPPRAKKLTNIVPPGAVPTCWVPVWGMIEPLKLLSLRLFIRDPATVTLP